MEWFLVFSVVIAICVIIVICASVPINEGVEVFNDDEYSSFSGKIQVGFTKEQVEDIYNKYQEVPKPILYKKSSQYMIYRYFYQHQNGRSFYHSGGFRYRTYIPAKTLYVEVKYDKDDIVTDIKIKQ